MVSASRIRVMVVDDHPIMRNGLIWLRLGKLLGSCEALAKCPRLCWQAHEGIDGSARL